MKYPTAFLILMMVSAPAAAQSPSTSEDKNYSHEFAACEDTAGGVTFDEIDCITAETRRQDALLNQRYKALIATLKPARKEALLAAQRAWISFRDLNCQFTWIRTAGPSRGLHPISVLCARRLCAQRNLTI